MTRLTLSGLDATAYLEAPQWSYQVAHAFFKFVNLTISWNKYFLDMHGTNKFWIEDVKSNQETGNHSSFHSSQTCKALHVDLMHLRRHGFQKCQVKDQNQLQHKLKQSWIDQQSDQINLHLFYIAILVIDIDILSMSTPQALRAWQPTVINLHSAECSMDTSDQHVLDDWISSLTLEVRYVIDSLRCDF